MLLMLIVLQNRGDNEIMRAVKAALYIIVAPSSSCLSSSSVDKLTDPGLAGVICYFSGFVWLP